MLLCSFLKNNLCCSKVTDDTIIHFLRCFNNEPLKVLQFLSAKSLPYLAKTQCVERKATLKVCFKHIKQDTNAVDIGTNLTKESSIYQFCPSNAASIFESLTNLRHPKALENYLNKLPHSSSAVIFYISPSFPGGSLLPFHL